MCEEATEDMTTCLTNSADAVEAKEGMHVNLSKTFSHHV